MIAISLVELQLHVAAALDRHGIRAEQHEVLPDRDGTWSIQLLDDLAQLKTKAEAVAKVQAELHLRYRIHRLSLGGTYGG